jgi:hypothetical protein
MANNLVALSGLMASSTSIALWVVAAVLLAIIFVRRKARKANDQG